MSAPAKRLATGAVAIGAAVVFVYASPAQGLPIIPLRPPSASCTSYGFNGPFSVRGNPDHGGDADWTVSFAANGSGAGSGPATVVFDTGEKVTGHLAPGKGIEGRTADFTIQWENKPNNFWKFSGTVGDDGLVHDGRETNDALNAAWVSTTPLDCLGPIPVVSGVPVQSSPPPPPPPVPPTDAVNVTFARQGLNEIVTVTNTADLAGHCTYAASPVNNGLLPKVNRSFDIGARATVQLTVPAPPAFTTYRVVTSCRGTFDGKDIEFGHDEQDVSG